MVTLRPSRPRGRMGSGAFPACPEAAEVVVESAEVASRGDPTARAAGRERAVLRKFRREVEESMVRGRL